MAADQLLHHIPSHASRFPSEAVDDSPVHAHQIYRVSSDAILFSFRCPLCKPMMRFERPALHSLPCWKFIKFGATPRHLHDFNGAGFAGEEVAAGSKPAAVEVFLRTQLSNSRRTKCGLSIRTVAITAFFGGAIGLIRALLCVIPPDFFHRWRQFINEQPHSEPLLQDDPQTGTVLYDRHGTVIATLGIGTVGGKRESSKLESAGSFRAGDIPSFMWQAVVASEDRRFFEHHGIDPRGISRATLSLASSGGGSTITQQLVKNMFLTNERKWARKLLEMILALLLEKQMSKWDILHTYLNKIYWGHGMYGIGAACAFYFGKHPSQLTLGECAMLAGIIPAPELLSPYRDPSRGKKPQARALRRMVEAGFLDACTASMAVNEPLDLGNGEHEGTSGPWRAPYFVSEVLYELNKKYGQDKVLEGGLQVHTTLDLTMQETAEKVIRDELAEYDLERASLAEQGVQKAYGKLEKLWKARQEEMDTTVSKSLAREPVESSNATLIAQKAAASTAAKFSAMENGLQLTLHRYQEELKMAAKSRLEGAMVSIDPSNGAVRVLVGGRDYFESSFNRSTQAFRPPGSTFKPVVYLAALAEGIDKNHILVDEPYTIGGFSPENYDRKFRGQVTLEESLLRSLNVPTVKLCAEVGVDKVCRMGKVLGIEAVLPHELALSLGGCEVTPLQLATVYSTIAAGGVYHKPHLITRVENRDGQVLEEVKIPEDLERRVVDEKAVLELRKLLQAVVERGTGRAARIGRPCAGKTGTSDGHRDVWFAGFTPELSCVVWLGYDDNAPVGGLHPGTGASHAAPIWQRFMKSVLEDLPIRSFCSLSKETYAIKSSRQSLKRSRRPQRNGCQAKKKSSEGSESRTIWKDIWDWENASSVWEEREKMEEWTARHARRMAEIEAIQWNWHRILNKLGTGISPMFGHGNRG